MKILQNTKNSAPRWATATAVIVLAGAAALVKQANPGWTAGQIRSAARNHAHS
jgi:hypothetical protein